MDSNLSKLAAQAIKEQKDEIASLKKELAQYKTASAMAFDLFQKGTIPAEDLESSFNCYSFNCFLEKDEKELEVLEKAAEYRDASTHLSMGSLSERPADDGTLDPLTSMLIEDL